MKKQNKSLPERSYKFFKPILGLIFRIYYPFKDEGLISNRLVIIIWLWSNYLVLLNLMSSEYGNNTYLT